MQRRREIVGTEHESGQGGADPELGALTFGYREPDGVWPALGIMGIVAMIAGESVPGGLPHAPVLPPLSASAQSDTFPQIARPLCGVLRCALANAPKGTVLRDRFCHAWTDTLKRRAEKIAEMFCPADAVFFLRQVGQAVSHLCRDRAELAWDVTDLANHIDVREDAAQAAKDLLTKKDSFGETPVALPLGGGALPGKAGKHFALGDGVELAEPAPVPFPARAILIRALRGNPASVGYVRNLAFMAGVDPRARAATRALRRADALRKIEIWTGHYVAKVSPS